MIALNGAPTGDDMSERPSARTMWRLATHLDKRASVRAYITL
jgi:hypothetical protein